MNPLVGKTLIGIKIASDRQALLFQTSNDNLTVHVEADCCSYTWIEHIELPALGFPALVIAVEDLDMPEQTEESNFHSDPEVLSFYGCKITTDKGDIVIDYRNDSNGYYGGSLAWPEDYFSGPNTSTCVWQEVSEALK